MKCTSTSKHGSCAIKMCCVTETKQNESWAQGRTTMCSATDGDGRPENNVQSPSILFCPIVFWTDWITARLRGPASERAHCEGYAFQSGVKVAVVTFTTNFLTNVMKISTELWHYYSYKQDRKMNTGLPIYGVFSYRSVTHYLLLKSLSQTKKRLNF